jgi:hypothetical protein
LDDIYSILQGIVKRYVQKFNSAVATLTITENSGELPDDENNIDVYYGGQMLTPTDDYTVSGSNIVLTFTPKSSVTILVKFIIVV